MFSLYSSFNKTDVVVKVKHDNKELEFVLSSVVSKRNKEDLDHPDQFTLLNSYLDYKGEQFKSVLFNAMSLEYQYIMDDLLMSSEIYPLPYRIVDNIISLFDFQDLFNYIKFNFRLAPPSNLADVFDEQIEKDSRGSRVQTYLKDDYIELATVATIIKAATPTLTHFAYIKQKDFSPAHREYMLFHVLKPNPICESNAMIKLQGLIEKLIEQTNKADDSDAIRVLEKQLPKDELPTYLLAIVVMQKICVAPLVGDDAVRNIITKVYNYVNNKLKATGDIAKSIRSKNPMTDSESGIAGDTESFLESHRLLESIEASYRIELNWAVSDINKIIYQMPESQKKVIDMVILEEAKAFCKKFLDGNIERTQIDILSTIFKTIIDPRGFDYLTMENIYNLLSVGFAYLWGIGSKNIALLLVSQLDESSSGELSINITVNKSRLSKELREELDYYYPYKRIINSTTFNNIVEDVINKLTTEFYSNKWICVADGKYIEEVLGEINHNRLIPVDIKNMLAEFFIKNERLVGNE